ncbi:SEC14-like protein 2 [Daphnia carinata]|uniref:SEC14-like protein 2 n=1 Tax=Daphnia carinata TaxID=120202 RepID=UPI002868BADB|nr:SEC14-like protein 2 [Daphnia carinata]
MVVSCETREEILKQFKRNIADCNLNDGSGDDIVKWLVVSIIAFGKADWRGMLQSVSKRDYLRYLTYMAESNCATMRKNSLLAGKPVTHQTFLIDMDGLSMRQMSFKPFREVGFEAIKISEANYPESLRRVFIINAPKAFTFVFSMVKPFLHQSTLDKMSVFGFDKNEWSTALLKEIDADQLPVHYGGTMTDSNGDAKCSNMVNVGGPVPSSYYLGMEKPLPKEDMASLILSCGMKKKLEFKIVAANSTLKFEFMTEEGDIGFRVYYLENEKDKVDVINNVRVESHMIMEEGEIVCTRPALYVVQFDNSYSYLRSKTIWYRIVVHLPSFDKYDQFGHQ